MPGFSYLILVLLIGTISISCGSDNLATDRLTSTQSSHQRIEDEIYEIESISTDDGPDAEALLDRRFQEDKAMITALTAEISAQYYTYASETRMIEFQQNQTSELLRQEISSLGEQIRTTEQSLVEKKNLVYGFIAPPETSDVAAAHAEILQGEQALELLRARRIALQSDLLMLPNQYSEQLSRVLDSTRSKQTDLTFMIASTQSDLDRIAAQRMKMTSARMEREKKLSALRQELSDLEESATKSNN